MIRESTPKARCVQVLPVLALMQVFDGSAENMAISGRLRGSIAIRMARSRCNLEAWSSADFTA